MKIKYKQSWETKYNTHTLSQIVEAKAYDDGGAVERAISRATIAIEFAEKTIEMLYKKGLIDDVDVGNLVSEFCSCDADDVKVISE